MYELKEFNACFLMGILKNSLVNLLTKIHLDFSTLIKCQGQHRDSDYVKRVSEQKKPAIGCLDIKMGLL